jgi:transglutaminase-like putative cysteine protease
MIYDVSHKTLYAYSTPVIQSQHLVHMSPRPVGHQIVKRHNLLIEPAPTRRVDYLDYFGNPASILDIEAEHSELVIHARSTIEVTGRPAVNVKLSAPCNLIATRLAGGTGDLNDIDIIQFVAFSRHTMPTLDIVDYARPSFAPDRPVLDAAWDLVCRIHADFKFDSAATDVSTPVTEVLKLRRGVCQDFSHLALSCLRAFHMPARYVSGYLLTHPAPGMPKLQGADASHAWISVWAPETGWVDFDPTNRIIPDSEHITIAHGRDYDDVNPISGILLGGGEHRVTVAVDVAPIK